MVQKELLCSVVAYNLVLQLRREAAKVADVPPRRLSFTGVWTTMQICLLQQPACTWEEWRARYERAVQIAATHKLPNRPGRNYRANISALFQNAMFLHRKNGKRYDETENRECGGPCYARQRASGAQTRKHHAISSACESGIRSLSVTGLWPVTRHSPPCPRVSVVARVLRSLR